VKPVRKKKYKKTKTFMMLEKMIETTRQFQENFSGGRKPKYLSIKGNL
jgi:hypothetical protein